MLKQIRNTTLIKRTYQGKIIGAGATHQIPVDEISRWGGDQAVVNDILSGILVVGSDTTEYAPGEGLAYLLSVDAQFVKGTPVETSAIGNEKVLTYDLPDQGLEYRDVSSLSTILDGAGGWMQINYALDEAFLDNTFLPLVGIAVAGCALPKPIKIVAWAINCENQPEQNWYVDLVGKYQDFYVRTTFEKRVGGAPHTDGTQDYGVNLNGYATYPAGAGPKLLIRKGSDGASRPVVSLWYVWAKEYLSNNLAQQTNSLTITSSSLTGTNTPEKVREVGLESYWESASATNEWLLVDFHEPTRLRVWGLMSFDGNRIPRIMHLQGSNDGVAFTTIKTITYQNTSGQRQYFQLAPSEEGLWRYYRFFFVDNYGGATIIVNELALYAWFT